MALPHGSNRAYGGIRMTTANDVAESEPSEDVTRLVRALVAELGGRYSTELGIDLQMGGGEIERWFLAATLFGSRISASVAMRTYRELASAGIAAVQDVEGRSWEQLVELLDAGGYARYDYRMASRLHALALAVQDRLGGRVESLAGLANPHELEAALDSLPGWGPVTVGLFLRELRGVWPGAEPEPDSRVAESALNVGLARAANAVGLEPVASAAGVDARDLEAALVRLSIAHGRAFDVCPGGSACTMIHLRAA